MFIRDTYNADVQQIILRARAERSQVIAGMCLTAVNTIKSWLKLAVTSSVVSASAKAA